MEARVGIQALLQRLRNDRKLAYLLAAIALFCVAYVGFALTPSSYAAGLEWLGLPREGLVLGHPQSIRSDEWIVFTPYVQIAVENSFAQTNAISPYHEDLRSFLPLPIADWALLFKPYHWGFFALPPANAYSLYFLLNSLAFLLGWTLLLSKLRVDARLAFLTALALYFSQFVQVWWTSNSGVFAYAPWPAIAWLHFANRGLRIALTSYALLVWLLSCAYPPFIYASALSIGVLLLACRPDMVDRKRLLDACISGSIALGLFIAYFGELIDLMQNTVYPGQRESTGGGVENEKLFAHLYPFFAIDGFEPLSKLKNSNACEVAVLSTLLPVFAIFLLDTHSLGESIRRHTLRFAIIASGLIFMAAWLTLPISGFPAKATGLFTTPPNRMLLGFGILLNAASAIALANCRLKISPLRLLLAPTFLAASAFGKLWHSGESVSKTFSWHEAAMFLVVGSACLYLAIASATELRRKLILFGACAIVNVVAFGLFNPVQSAYPIFSLDKNRLRASLSERGSVQIGDYYAVPGQYGALLAGAGIPSINHVLLYPQMTFFRQYFHDMSEDEFNYLFNRYEHVSLQEEGSPRLAGPDHVFLPISAFAAPGSKKFGPPTFLPRIIPIKRLSEKPSTSTLTTGLPLGHIDSISRTGSSIIAQGWVHAASDRATIEVWTSAVSGEIEAVTVRRRDVARLVDSTLLDSGVRISFDGMPNDGAEICIVVRDQEGRASTVHFPDGTKMCSRLP